MAAQVTLGPSKHEVVLTPTLAYMPTAVRSDGVRSMKIAPWYLAALAPFAALGYSGAHLGHLFVVLLTMGIFLGTLTIGKLPGQTPKTDP